jgi:hypothetical protein
MRIVTVLPLTTGLGTAVWVAPVVGVTPAGLAVGLAVPHALAMSMPIEAKVSDSRGNPFI